MTAPMEVMHIYMTSDGEKLVTLESALSYAKKVKGEAMEEVRAEVEALRGLYDPPTTGHIACKLVLSAIRALAGKKGE